MMKTITVILFILSTVETLAQQTELDKRNGFKDIALLSAVDSIKGVKYKKDITEKNNVPAKLYVVDHPDYQSIGEIKVDKIELKAYKGLIYEIAVYTEKDPRLMKAMENALGKSQYDSRYERYFWNGENLLLTFESSGKKDLLLTYKSHLIQKIIKEDKEKKVDEIADDF